jgi:hypothetical protein
MKSMGYVARVETDMSQERGRNLELDGKTVLTCNLGEGGETSCPGFSGLRTESEERLVWVECK